MRLFGRRAGIGHPNHPNKHQLKSEATRTALLDAAEEIFARYGYERAQIEEIAKLCGRTRGAVYAQYGTKEQFFFALLERSIEAARSKAYQSMGKRPHTGEERFAAVREIYADLRDANTAMLDMEMKLFALRTPESRSNWRAHYLQLFHFDDGASVSDIFGISEAPGRSHIQSRLYALTALKSGLILAMRFMPQELSQKEAKLLLKEIFDGLFPASERTTSRGGQAASTKSTGSRRLKKLGG